MHGEHAAEPAVEAGMSDAVIGTIIAVGGVALAALLYLANPAPATALQKLWGPFYWLSAGKLFVDQIYAILFVWPLRVLAAICYWLDRTVVRRPGEPRRQHSTAGGTRACGRCKPAWCSSTDWRCCGVSWYWWRRF